MPENDPTRPAKPQPRIGSYQLLNSLGSGGMSSVFKAVHVETGHVVALKVLPRALAKNITLLQRFLREAKSAEALEHANIVSIYDRGVDQGRYYLVLEYVEGGDLHDRVRNGGPLKIAEATAVIRAVCKGLQFAASRGLIHRDIKPANILMSTEGVVKIIDLGLALQAENEDERVTREGTTVGTVDYMAPEQARDSRATSERSDMYSLGCTFFFLLTGSPPYPGGDVADKLSRHCLKPPPDPRDLRPEIPAPLALLMQRMMAKRPENRFVDYEELIDELDAVPTGDESLPEVPLFALIDEQDDESKGGEPTPAQPGGEPLFALVDDDDEANGESDDLPVGLLAPERDAPSRPDRTRPRDLPPSPAEVSMAELAALSEDSPRVVSTRTPSADRQDREAPANPLAEALLADEFDEEEEEAIVGSMRSLGPRIGGDSNRKLILTYAFVGLGLVLLVIGSHQLIRLSRTNASQDIANAEPLEEKEFVPVIVAPEPPAPPTAAPVPTHPIAAKPAPKTPPKPAQAAPIVAWVEPTDPPAERSTDVEGPVAMFASHLPEWSRVAVPERIGPRFVTVRRIVDPRDSTQAPSLRLALDVIGGTVELADNGPFFEDDLRVAGETRLIRARPGFRPIVAIESPKIDAVRGQPAVVVLDGKSLILDGVDLVVNVPDLPRNQSALFYCRGGSLTLRRCTITVINPRAVPFDVVRTQPASNPSRIRMDETLVRGLSYTAIRLGLGASEVVLNRSMLVGGRNALISTRASQPGGSGTLNVVQSLLCARGPIFEVGSYNANRSTMQLDARLFGSTFANLSGEGTTSMIVSSPEVEPVEDQIRWSGDDNAYAGWHDWSGSGPGRAPKVANLAAARSAWPNSDQHSREDSGRWNVSVELDRVVPRDIVAACRDARELVAHVADPSPFLLQKTLESFPRLRVPPLAAVTPAQVDSPPPRAPSVAGEAAGNASTGLPQPLVRDLVFDLSASPWNGDLGLFLRDQIKPGDRRVRVLVSGGGWHRSTPVRLPDGVSLEVRPNPGDPAGGAAIIWSPQPSGERDALIDVKGGDLVLSNIRLSRDASSHTRHLVRVERGHLVVDQCWFTALGQGEDGGGGLVEFRAQGTKPMPGGPSPYQSAPDRPVCSIADSLIITGGDAVLVELGRGAVVLSNCAIAAGNDAFRLMPSKVARSRFDATLCLERCTIAAEGSFVHLGRWPGTEPGPDRPWLVTTKDSAFVSSYDRTTTTHESVLLRADDESLAQGALFWQSVNGAYDVWHFTARSGEPVATNRRPDVERHWVHFWGEAHMHGSTGPIWSRGSAIPSPSVRLHDKLTSGHVAPSDLELDPNYHPGRARLSVGADLSRIQVESPRRGRRP